MSENGPAVYCKACNIDWAYNTDEWKSWLDWHLVIHNSGSFPDYFVEELKKIDKEYPKPE